MSKERQRARAAREAARAAEVQAAAERRAREAKRADRLPKVSLPRRRRRYGALSTRELGQLVALWVALQVVVYFLTDSLQARLALAVLTAAVLAVLTATRRRSSTR